MSQHGRKPWSSEPYSQQADENRAAKTKIFYFGLLIVTVFGILTIQLARMQLVNGDKYKQRAETNRLRQEPIEPSRGLIYDRNGVPIVENVPTYAAAIVAADVPDGKETDISIELQELTGTPAGDIVDTIKKRKDSNDPFSAAVIKDNLTQEQAFTIREKLASLPGVRVVVEPERHYLFGTLMSQVVGFVGPIYQEDYASLAPKGYQLDDRIGKAGVESTYESFLRGTPGSQAIETDASGRQIKVLGETPATPGMNVVLSIDVNLQQEVENVLKQNMGDSLNAACIVIDVHTGDILALVSLPDYDSNTFSGQIDEAALEKLANDPAKPMLDHAISEEYQPGSTFKQVTGTAALQEGVATANTEIFSPGYLNIQNEYNPNLYDTFKDWRSDLGTMNFYRGLAMSSDVYFYELAGGYVKDGKTVFQGLGADRLAKWARQFGLGAPTGIDLPGEASGLVPDPAWKEKNFGEGWLLGDTYNFGIGQGYLNATPIQMVRVTAAIANGGDVLIPHVVKELKDSNGNVITLQRQTVQQKLNVDPSNLAVVREGMRESVADGAAFTAAEPDVVIAGKTGTAEFGERHPDGSYDEHGWFTGFAPFDNPQVAIVVFMQKGNGQGTAAPTGGKILEYYFSQLKVADSATTPK